MRLSFLVIACLVASSSAWDIASHETKEALLHLFGLPQELSRHSLEAPLEFKWDDCGGADATLKINNIFVGPDPIVLPGNVTAAFNVTGTADAASPLKAEVLLQKKIGLWITIPCLDNIGSCTYADICSMLPSGDCPELFKEHGIPCHCPFKAGSYVLPTSVIPVKVGNLPSWLTNGDYHGKVTVTNESGGTLACVEVYVSLKAA